MRACKRVHQVFWHMRLLVASTSKSRPHGQTFDMQQLMDHRRLSDEAIVDFVRHLCAVSREEMDAAPAAPRVFSMQKIVEITYYNMSRIRIVWSRIWAILGEHFQSVALRKDQQLSMYAIDSMRQLAFKFLEKDELTSFHFQRDFLKPFDYIIANSPSPVIRELVVRCLTQVVRSTSRNIKSGWKNIFQVLNVAARDETDTVVVLAFDLVQKLVRTHTLHGGVLQSCVRDSLSVDIFGAEARVCAFFHVALFVPSLSPT